LSLSPEDRSSDADLRRYATQLAKLGVSIEQPGYKDCKGLIVVGTFRKTPIDQRVEARDFPDPVSRLVSRQNICALTGATLLSMVLASRNDPILKAQFLEKLTSTAGILEEVPKLSNFLTPRGSEVA
jgi:hypothetical protein